MKLRFIRLPAFTHKTAFSSGNLLPGDNENKLSNDALQKLLRRHTSGDWGDIPRALRQTNRYVLEYSNGLLSCYFHPFSSIRMVTIHTCADSSQTVISVHA